MQSQLTTGQFEAYKKIKEFLNSVGGGMFLLSGVAGTGKTHLMAKLVTEYKKKKILVAGPTHKSVKVIRNEAGIDYANVTFTTVHSALGLKEKIDGYGKVTYVIDKTEPNKIQKNHIEYMIIDETSMLNDDLFNELTNYIGNSLKILFMGDPIQIPPINTDNSLPFKKSIQEKYNIQTYELTEVIRQAKGHPIIDLGQTIRDNISSSKLPLPVKDINSSVGNISFVKSDLIKLFDRYFNSNAFDNDVDHARVLAWTNKSVNQYNNMIRRIIFKNQKPPKIMQGERLTLTAAVEKDGRVILQNNDEVEVVSYKIAEESVSGFDRNIKYYDTVVKYESKFFGNIHHKIRIIHEDSESDFDEILDMVKRVALSYKQGSEQARGYWLMYYEMQEYYAKVVYSYCLTCHKAQGSSFTNVIVDYDDIMLNSRLVERNRIFYTAITRSRKNLYVIKIV